MSGSSDRAYLTVPYEEREQVKALGGRWDREAKSWYVPAGVAPEAAAKWVKVDRDPREQFADELRRAGFHLNGGHPVMDGKIHRLAVDGDKGVERNGSYCGFLDGRPGGWLQNFKSMQEPAKWKAAGVPALSEEARAEMAATVATSRREAERKRDGDASRAAQVAAAIWNAASPATAGHPYLASKQVGAHGLAIAAPGTTIETETGEPIDIAGRLLVPVRDAGGRMASLQIIDDRGGKMFLRGGKVAGGRHVIGDAGSPWPLLVAEGYATAATLHEATGHAVAVAFNAHNLGLVAAQHRAARPDRSIFIAGDNDHHRPLQTDPQGRPKRNVGREAAIAAATAVEGHALIPDFQPGERGTDWNDAVKVRGLAAVRRELATGLARGARIKIAKDIEAQRGHGQATERARGRETVGIER